MTTKNEVITEAKAFLTDLADHLLDDGLPKSAEAVMLIRDNYMIDPDPEPASPDNTHIDDIVWEKRHEK